VCEMCGATQEMMH